MQPCQENSRSFFHKLQSAKDLDLRDERGKRHELAVVLTGVMLAVLSNRDGCLSSIQRHIENHYQRLVVVLEVEKKKAVSRSQLPRILERVSVSVFDDLIFSHFGLRLNEKEQKWFAFDGKELRGSIEKGERRGEVLVQAVSHETGETVAQDYYCGLKQSEKPKVREVLEQSGLAGQKISFDALHLNPKTLLMITKAKGKYVVGVKANQKQMLNQVIREIDLSPFLYESEKSEKGHGRIETRRYEIVDILEMEKAKRWEECQIRTAIKVNRETEEVKSGKTSRETSYYVSNEVGRYEEIVEAIRGHWQVETNNHLRDVTLKEDDLRSEKKNLQKTLAGVRTLATIVLNRQNCQNKKAQLEKFSDDFDSLIIALKSINFL